MKLFDEFGNTVGEVASGGGWEGGLFALGIILAIGEFWLIYKFFQFTFRGFKMIFTGDSNGWRYLIPFLVLAGILLIGLLNQALS